MFSFTVSFSNQVSLVQDYVSERSQVVAANYTTMMVDALCTGFTNQDSCRRHGAPQVVAPKEAGPKFMRLQTHVGSTAARAAQEAVAAKVQTESKAQMESSASIVWHNVDIQGAERQVGQIYKNVMDKSK